MVDIVSPAKRSIMMSGIHGKNTKPEIIVRKLLFSAGYRYRLYRKDLPGTPDIVLPKYRCAIFVNGCFWHGHDNCPLFRLPKSNTDFWRTKIGGNISRDHEKYNSLLVNGWRIVIVWECALKGARRVPEEDFQNLLYDAVSGQRKFVTIRGNRFKAV